MALTLDPVSLPLRVDPTGAVRVGQTRVTLDTIVESFKQGDTAEQIAQNYPVHLADVYGTISFYLARKDEVEAYLGDRQARGNETRRQNQERFDQQGIRARLLARRPAQG